jgi:hypothetical protein
MSELRAELRWHLGEQVDRGVEVSAMGDEKLLSSRVVFVRFHVRHPDRAGRYMPGLRRSFGGQLLGLAGNVHENPCKSGGLWVARTPDLSDVNAAL